MKKIDELTETFKSRLDAFTIGCDSIEEIELWNKEENGELDVFCLNEYLTTILRLVAADGVISEQEAEYVNKNFGFSYTADELKDIYENCQIVIGDSFDERIREDIEIISAVNTKLAGEFKELVELICSIIAASDNAVADEERKEIEKIEKVLKNS